MTTSKVGEAESFPKRTTAVKSTETAKLVSSLVKQFYGRAQEAARNGEPIAWCMDGGGSVPHEVIRAAGYTPLFTEHYATVCAAKQLSMPFIERAEGDGFANFLCSYARTGLGYAARMQQEKDLVPAEAPWGGLPKPTVLVGRGTCEPGYKWYQAFGRYLGVPAYTVDLKRLPADADLGAPALKSRYIKLYKSQIQGLTEFLESRTGKKMDYAGLSQALQLSQQARALWAEVHQLRQAIPCPMPSGDMTSCIFPGYFMDGTQAGVDFYQQLRDEVKGRVDRGIGVIPNERYRLLWGGIAQWHNLGFYNLMENHGAVFVVETDYYREPFVELDFSDPIQAIAERSWGEWVKGVRRAQAWDNCGDARAGLVLQLARDYHLSGVVLHLIASCRPVSIGWAHTRNVLRDRLKLPTLLLESDICDPRASSEAQTRQLVESFVETMASQEKSC